MKPLIVSFFAVMLAFTLFFDKEEVTQVDNMDQGLREFNAVTLDEADTSRYYTGGFHVLAAYIQEFAYAGNFLYNQ